MRASACSCGKRCHPDDESAIAAAIRLSARRGLGLRVYACPEGAGYHLTKRPTYSAARAS